MRKIRTYHEVHEPAGGEVPEQVVAQRERLARRMAGVGALVAVASGKGGVGKSAVTANLATVLAARGHRVGALDADLNGPSLARMLGVSERSLVDGADGAVPPAGLRGVKVVSMELLQADSDSPLRWREPAGDAYLWRGALEAGALREFLSDVAWGELDYLLVDVPPGTDRIGRLLDLVPSPDALLLVTTPSEMARAVVARSARLVREAEVAVVGLVANMTEWVCPDCHRRTPLFGEDGVDRLADDAGVEVWARVPFDPRLAAATDSGTSFAAAFPDSPVAAAFEALADRLGAETHGSSEGRREAP